MKNAIFAVLFAISSLLSGCKEETKNHQMKFATSADYPPFEYHEGGEIKGFDIDLAKLIAKELKKEAVFEEMQFSTVLAALQNGSVDAAISTITTTEEREKNFDFSNTYYVEILSIVYPKTAPITTEEELSGKKIACQLGSTMEIWLKEHVPDAEIIVMNNNNQAIKALKAGYVDGVFIDEIQGVAFSEKNSSLSNTVIAESDNGYAIAFKKGSSLRDEVNAALDILEKNGELEKLKKKWFENE